MKWNLRLAAANRGIWKASELQRKLAERGMKISAGKMSGLWSGQPNTVKLDELDVICAVLGCGVEELLLPEPDTVPQPTTTGEEQVTAVGEARTVTPGRAEDDHCHPGELPALRNADPCGKPARSALLRQQVPSLGIYRTTQGRC